MNRADVMITHRQPGIDLWTAEVCRRLEIKVVTMAAESPAANLGPKRMQHAQKFHARGDFYLVGLDDDPHHHLTDPLAHFSRRPQTVTHLISARSLLDELVEALQVQRVPLRQVDGWRTRHLSLPFTPEGVMVHHTAEPHPYPMEMIIHGRPRLEGPLANFLIRSDGATYLVAAGAIHGSGMGVRSVLERIQSGLRVSEDAAEPGDINGNRWFWNVEVDHPGDDSPYPGDQIKALVLLCAALCRFHGWRPRRVIHHRQWTSRKNDMSWHGPLHHLIRDHL